MNRILSPFSSCRWLSLLLMTVFVLPNAFSRDYPQSASGKVVDSYSRELMKEFRADLLRLDSTLIKSYFATESYSYNQPMNLVIDSLPPSDCLLYVTAEGYYPEYRRIARPGKLEWGIELHPIMMNRVPFYNPRQLEEVTVTVSKLKMVMKGDTIVYNADAFALTQGSMLDGLISQLPGVELKSGGQIYVNGKFVDELLVNGENFFKGDPRIALENLPAYMVNDVSVYHRNERMERKQPDELPLVMDVKLKKQYQTGWIANAEAGYGTSNRYLGRLFGLMFTRDSRLSLVANVNNTNDDRKPGQTDSWNPDWQTAGQADIAKAGIEYLWNSRLRSWKVETNLMAEHKRGKIDSEQASERYLEGGNMSGTSRSSLRSRQWRVSTDDKISFHVPRLWVDLKPKAAFIREKATEAYASTTSDAMESLLNSLDQSSETYRRLWEAGTELYGRWDLPQSTDKLENNFSLLWTDRHYETDASRSLLFPQQPDLNERQSPLEIQPERRLKIAESLKFGGSVQLAPDLTPSYYIRYSFGHDNLNSTRHYYDETANDLPSSYGRNRTLVPSKSFHYVATDNLHALGLNLFNFFPHVAMLGRREQFSLGLTLDINYAPGHIDYRHVGKVIHAQRAPWYLEPKVDFNLGLIRGTYSCKTRLAHLLDLVDITDSANPLYIYAGNPDLKNGRIHTLELMSWWFHSKGLELNADFHKYENMVAQSAAYDAVTGITTFRPVNVSGNWDVSAKASFNRQLGARKKWQVSSGTRFAYQNSVELINLDVSTVHNLNLSEKLTLTYKLKDGLELAGKGNLEYRRASSPTVGFMVVNAFDFDYGLVIRATKLPLNLSLTTDIVMHSRRGYYDSRLNTDHLVWNARLAKSILQGSLIFALDGFDILGRLSNVCLTMNSQGRTEARYNTLPRYAMLHVIYRLNIQSRKK